MSVRAFSDNTTNSGYANIGDTASIVFTGSESITDISIGWWPVSGLVAQSIGANAFRVDHTLFLILSDWCDLVLLSVIWRVIHERQ